MDNTVPQQPVATSAQSTTTVKQTISETLLPPSERPHSSRPSSLAIVLGVAALLALVVTGVSGYMIGKMQSNTAPPVTDNTLVPPTEEGVICTMDAMVCPDGSSVGRVGPNCEFAPCPSAGTPATASGKLPAGSEVSIVEITGVQVPPEVAENITVAYLSHLADKKILLDTVVAEGRSMSFEVYKANEEWFFGMGVVSGSKNCVIPSGATECGLPGPAFLMIGRLVNGEWTVGVEYTPTFTQLIQQAPESIVPAEQKKVYLPS